MSFLLLPIEIRHIIYRELRNYQSPIIPPVPSKTKYENGYCSYGFPWSIQATCRQIHDEARQVFYSENDWTFFVGSTMPFNSRVFFQSPLASALPLIRRAHIRFRVFNWLVAAQVGEQWPGARNRAHEGTVCNSILSLPHKNDN